jgi:glycosyltransferase involved in cell wall biosynthesis
VKKFSVVIPILNMAHFVERVTKAMSQGNFGSQVEEIIFVCDKSTDGTEDRIRDLQKSRKSTEPQVVLVQPEVRRGHFQARYLGAKAARTSTVFFIDARVTLTEHSLEVLPTLASKYPAMCANIDIDIHKNIFSLYWQRSHETIFSRTFKANQGINVITFENYDQQRIGTTCFFCSRDVFVQVCEKYYGKTIFSDDTLVQKDLVKIEPITLHPEFRVWWEPRDRTKAFLKHLYIRGPGFAEYHLFKKRGWLFYAFSFGFLFCLLDLILLFLHPWFAIGMALGVLTLMAATTALMAKSLKEFLILAPLHTASMIAYGVGAIRGIWMVLKNKKAGNAV